MGFSHGAVMLDMNLRIAEIKDAASLHQFPCGFQFAESRFDSADQVNRDRQLMMAGQDPADLQTLNVPKGLPKQRRVRGWVESIQASAVNQIAGVEVLLFRFVKTAMPRRMSGCMNDGQLPVS